MKTKQVIAGREIELEAGRAYMCGIIIMGQGLSRFGIEIRDVTEKEWFDETSVALIIPNLTNRQAEDFLYVFNHGNDGFRDRIWQ